jgi:hypothetical protein
MSKLNHARSGPKPSKCGLIASLVLIVVIVVVVIVFTGSGDCLHRNKNQTSSKRTSL